jgi:NAD(P)-dependent dehydrogenase (short-subunit alcohol dehydrogenase family)
MPESVDPRHLLLIGAVPGVGAGVVRRFGREGFRRTLISRGGTEPFCSMSGIERGSGPCLDS